MRDRAIDAVDVLNDLVGELITGTNLLRESDVQNKAGALSDELLSDVGKMCLSYLVLSCAKTVELYDKYRNILPPDVTQEMKELRGEIESRGILKFRNKVVGHIWDKDKRRVLRNSEVLAMLQAIMQGTVADFLNWLNPLHSAPSKAGVVNTLVAVRTALMQEYEIDPTAVIHR